jgi:hypothetical protein
MTDTTATLMRDIKADADRLTGPNNSSAQHYVDALQNVANAHVGRATSGATPTTRDYLSILKSSLNSQVDNYNSNSQRLIDYSDMHATNTYVRQELQSEHDRIKDVLTKLRGKIYTSKSQSQEYLYQSRRYDFLTFAVLLTAMTILLSFNVVRANLKSTISDTTMFVLLLIMGTAYIIFMSYSLVKNTYRTRLDWTKFYFDKHQEKKTCIDVTTTKSL